MQVSYHLPLGLITKWRACWPAMGFTKETHAITSVITRAVEGDGPAHPSTADYADAVRLAKYYRAIVMRVLGPNVLRGAPEEDTFARLTAGKV